MKLLKYFAALSFFLIIISWASYCQSESKEPGSIADKKAIFSFIFDDGNLTDSNVVKIFDRYGWKVGFALITKNIDTTKKERYLNYQSRGYEILSHSVVHGRFDGHSVYAKEQAAEEMKISIDSLRSWGFRVNGWVTPFSAMKPEFTSLLKKYYRYAYTVYLGKVTSANQDSAIVKSADGLFTMNRISLESSAEADLLDAIDYMISRKAVITFYCHKYPDKLSEQTLTAILDKLKSREKNGEISVLIPYLAFSQFINAN